MKLYNTMSKTVEKFIPNKENKVTMYTCGPTVYNYAHIGNLRTYISEDILEKTLTYLGYEVKRCMNITDVGHLVSDADTGDDKMSVASKRENKSVLEIAQFYTDEFFKDMEKLNIKKPEYITKATDMIDEYIEMILKLIDNGYAYLSSGNVYFDTEKYQDYYKLSGMKKNEQLIGARENVSEDLDKKNPADFGLWFTNSKFDNQELKWDSPWGIGYPGWHIECSAISIKNLGEHLDIHCGGIDAIFPHHTNEIAQSECYLNHKWCNYWVHMEFLNDTSGKMSKSSGEFLNLQLLIDKGYDPVIYRYMCLQSHYRKILVFSYDALDNAKSAYMKLKNKVSLLKGEVNLSQIDKYIIEFKEALQNDLNTSLALTVLYDVLKSDISDGSKLYLVKEFDKVLGLNLQVKNETSEDKKIYIEEMIEKRKKAKMDKNYELSDQIRNELLLDGIVLKDTKDGTIYEIN